MAPILSVPRRRAALRLSLVIVAVLLLATLALAGPAGAATATNETANGSANATQADVVFVFDNSQSTNENRYHMAQEIDEFDERLDAAGVDSRYGLVTYNETVRVEQPLNASFDAFERAMHFGDGGNEERASDAILTATDMEFRDDAERVIVIVTDEDDDSSAATREAALANLSGVHLVAVSPADPATSSCAVHSPPCDNSSENELRTMAASANGSWIDIDNDAADVVAEIGNVTVSRLAVAAAEPEPRPDFELTALSANRTTAEVGDPVSFNATVANNGTADGDYRAYLSSEGVILNERNVTIPRNESRTIMLVHAFDTPGEYEMVVTHESAATVTVTPPNATSVVTETRRNGTAVIASVSDAWANGTVSVPVGDAALGGDAATLDAVSVALGDVNVTPAHDAAFTFAVAANATPPDGVPALPEHVAQRTYLGVNSSLGPHLSGVGFDYTPTADDTTVYRYDDASGWVPLDATARETDGAQLRTDISDSAAFAVGVRQAAFEVTAVELDSRQRVSGEMMSVTVTVENGGTADGVYEATLRANGTAVGTQNVSVPASESRQVVFEYTPERTGQHALSVGDVSAETLQVEAPATATPTATPTPTPTTAASTPVESTPTTETDTPVPDDRNESSALPPIVLIGLVPLALGALLFGVIRWRQ